MISLRTLLLFYRRHLRVQPLRELMAVLGVAAGVALLFAVQVANSSITGAFQQVVHGIAGRATLEVAARSPEGFQQSIYEEVAHMRGVRAAAPILSQQALVAGPKGRRALMLVGADDRLTALGGELILRFERYAEASSLAGLLVMTQPIADVLGARRGRPVSIGIDGQAERLTVGAIVPGAKLGPLAESPIVAAPIPVVQALAHLPDRITRILVQPVQGREALVRGALEQRYGAQLDVRSIDSESQLLSDAAKPEGQLTALFSAISLVVGVILAYNALLLASGERRAFIAYLVQLGTTDVAIVTSLAFDAFILGIVGSLAGLLAGDAISLLAYRAPPGYLTAAFPIGGQRILLPHTVLIAFGAGMLAAFAAAALPAIALLRANPAGQDQSRALALLRRPRVGDTVVFACGSLLICLSIGASLISASVIVPALVALAAGLVLCLPLVMRYTLALARTVSRHSSDPAVRLATGELRTSATRSVALVATGTIAVFLMVTIGGSIKDVQQAVRLGARQTGSSGELWVKPQGAQDIYATQPFDYASVQRRIQSLSIVRSVLAYRQSFLDLPGRRVWVIGVPSQAHSPIARSQLVHGDAVAAERRLREGGWTLVSQTIASQRHLHIGQPFDLPTPSGRARLRLAATISNYGWLPGTILLNGEDYSRLWHTGRASQLAITLERGTPLTSAKLAIQRVLPHGGALTVQTAQERQSQVSAVLGSTLSRLNQTSIAVLIAAIATVVAMMLSAVWQRRGRLDALISIGMSHLQLARLIFYESGCVLIAGCLIGLATGNLGQYLVDRWTQHSSGSPVRFAVAWQLAAQTVLIAGLISVAAAAIALIRTLRFQPKAAFSTD